MSNQRPTTWASPRPVEPEKVEAELKARLQQQAVVARLAQAALASTNLAVLMQEIIAAIMDTIRADLCGIFEYIPERNELLLRAGSGWQEGQVGQAVITQLENTQTGYAFRSEHPVIVNDLRTEKRFKGSKLVRQHGAISGISVAIPGKPKPFGVLSLHSTRPYTYTLEDANFLNSLAGLLAAAVMRVRTENLIEASRDQLKVILEGIADGITVQDPNLRVIYANQAAAAAMGFSSTQNMQGVTIADIHAKFELLDENGEPFPVERLPNRLALQGQENQSAVICYRDRQNGAVRWLLVKSTPVFNSAGQVEQAVTVFQDITALKQREARQNFLVVAGEMLSNSLDYTSTLESVTHLAVPRLADWCTVHLVEDDGNVQQIAMAHADPKKIELAREIQAHYPPNWEADYGLPRVLRTGEPAYYPEITDAVLRQTARDEEHYRLARELDLRSAVIVPLLARGRTLGAITLVWTGPNQRYTQEDVHLAEELARRAALAIDNAHLFQQLQGLNAELEARVARRTTQLQNMVTKLRGEILERQRAEIALRESEVLLESLFESAPDATILLDPERKIVRVSAQTEIMFGYHREELVGKPLEFLLPKRYRNRYAVFRNQNGQDNGALPIGAGVELNARRKDGSEFPVEIVLSPVETSQGHLTISAIRDISQRKQMQTELAEVHQRLIESVEAERLLISQELHDGPIQDMYVIGFQLKSLTDLITEIDIQDPALGEMQASALNTIEATKESVQDVVKVLRTMCQDLRPPALAPFGLEKAILAYIDTLRESNLDLEIVVELMPDKQILPERMRLALYRIFQHSVSNVLRHARASRLDVRFSFDAEKVQLEIQDNGCGFEVPKRWVELARKGHLGLVGTAERVYAIGGELKIESVVGQGTLIQVLVPLGEGDPGSEPAGL